MTRMPEPSLFLEAFIRRYLELHFPGRHFTPIKLLQASNTYVIREHDNALGRELRILGSAKFDMYRLIDARHPEGLRRVADYISKQLRDAFGTPDDDDPDDWYATELERQKGNAPA